MHTSSKFEILLKTSTRSAGAVSESAAEWRQSA